MTCPHAGTSERIRSTKRDLLTASALSLLMLGSASALAQDQKAASCAALTGRTVAADAIGLPTKGATIASATLTTAKPVAQDARGGFTPANRNTAKFSAASLLSIRARPRSASSLIFRPPGTVRRCSTVEAASTAS